MDRRDFVIGAAASVVGTALAGAAGAASHGDGHDHGQHGHHTTDPKLGKVVESTLACERAAGDCVRHCIEMLAEGHGDMAECLDSVLRMRAVTGAMHAVAVSEHAPSKRTRELAAVCAAFCRDCAEACKPHADKHAECQACLEACEECAEACEALAG